MTSKTYRFSELLVLFVTMPLLLILSIPIVFKVVPVIMAFVYALWVLLRVENIKLHIAEGINWKRFWKMTFIKFVGIAVLTTLYLLAADPESLFNVVIHKPKQWLLFLGIYSLFSVYPQELIYRTFFFKRYGVLFKNEYMMLAVNAIVFSLAHLFFANALVLVITLVGGFLFGLTFKRTNSTLLVTIEHILYGGWLYTVGYGAMLGFPV